MTNPINTLREIHEKATDGAYKIDPADNFYYVVTHDDFPVGRCICPANAKSIVTAHNMMPVLLDLLEAVGGMRIADGNTVVRAWAAHNAAMTKAKEVIDG